VVIRKHGRDHILLLDGDRFVNLTVSQDLLGNAPWHGVCLGV
jgi:hypothetical protein